MIHQIHAKIQNISQKFILGAFLMAALFSTPSFGQAKVIMSSMKDFPKLKVGEYAPYFKNAARCGGCIELHADTSEFAFGAAQGTFAGADGVYDITLTTCSDGDGLCDYKMEIDTKSVGATYRQKDYQTGTANLFLTAVWKAVPIKKGSVVQVMSNGSNSAKHKDGKGPGGFHMAHGRWTKVEFVLKSASVFRLNKQTNTLKNTANPLTTLGLDAQGRLLTLKSTSF